MVVLNRYKSIVVEEEPYLLELVRYLRLNPVRAQVVADRRALARYPWSGHSALLGAVPRRWQDTATVLTHFGPTRRRAVAVYAAFVAAGLPQGRRPEFQGGGLVRSHGGWAAVAATRRTGALGQADARILGTGDFVAAVLREAPEVSSLGRRPSPVPLEPRAARLAASLGVPAATLFGGTQTAAAVAARQLLAYVWVEVLGRRASDLARLARRGATSRWRPSVGRAMRCVGRGRSPLGVAGIIRPIMLRPVSRTVELCRRSGPTASSSRSSSIVGQR